MCIRDRGTGTARKGTGTARSGGDSAVANCNKFCRTKYAPQVQQADNNFLGMFGVNLGKKMYEDQCKPLYCNKGCKMPGTTNGEITYRNQLRKRLAPGASFLEKNNQKRNVELKAQGAMSNCDLYPKYNPLKT